MAAPLHSKWGHLLCAAQQPISSYGTFVDDRFDRRFASLFQRQLLSLNARFTGISFYFIVVFHACVNRFEKSIQLFWKQLDILLTFSYMIVKCLSYNVHGNRINADCDIIRFVLAYVVRLQTVKMSPSYYDFYFYVTFTFIAGAIVWSKSP